MEIGILPAKFSENDDENDLRFEDTYQGGVAGGDVSFPRSEVCANGKALGEGSWSTRKEDQTEDGTLRANFSENEDRNVSYQDPITFKSLRK